MAVDSLKGLAGIQAELNPKTVGEWPHWIGQFILNFASIEAISYQYLTWLEADRGSFNETLDMRLGKRIARIKALVIERTDLPPHTKQRIIDLWGEVASLTKWRNRIAHNAIMLSWRGGADPNTEPPSEIGIVEMRSLKTGDESSSLSMQDLRDLVRRTVAAGSCLNEEALAIMSVKSAT